MLESVIQMDSIHLCLIDTVSAMSCVRHNCAAMPLTGATYNEPGAISLLPCKPPNSQHYRWPKSYPTLVPAATQFSYSIEVPEAALITHAHTKHTNQTSRLHWTRWVHLATRGRWCGNFKHKKEISSSVCFKITFLLASSLCDLLSILYR